MAEPTSLVLGAPLVVTLSTSSTQSSVIGTANPAQPNAFSVCRFVSTIDAWIAIGVNPTAVVGTAGSFLLPANVVEYIDVPFGHRVAGIAAAAGTLSVTPGTNP